MNTREVSDYNENTPRELMKNILQVLKLNTLRGKLSKVQKVYRLRKLDREGQLLEHLLVNKEDYNFEQKQKDLLFAILNYAKENVPYYRTLLKDIHLEKKNIIHILKELPLLTKEIIRKEGNNMNSVEFEKVFSYWMNTGGSTGEPLRFPASKNFEHVHARCLYTVMGGNKKDIIASIDGSRIANELLEKHIFWKQGTENFPYGSIHLSTLYMSDRNMNFYIQQLNSVKPALMRGYPSGFENIAKYLIANNIDLKFIPKGIYLTSEFFDSATIELLNKAFKCPVFGQYGHAEVSVYAFTLANSLEYICSPLYGYTEILDENGNHVKENESGEVVVTGFSNKSMPFIRYKTGDIAVYGGTKNGVIKLKALQGRSVDYIVNATNKKIFLTGLIFGGHLKSFEKIKFWQIEQDVPGCIVIRIVKDLGYAAMYEKELIQLFESVEVKPELIYVDEIPLTLRGKRKFLIQNIR